MPSLFSRVRTASTPSKPPRQTQDDSALAYDELGRIVSRGSTTRPVPFPSAKKEKASTTKKDKSSKSRKNAHLDDEEPVIPDGSFLPLTLEPPPPRKPLDPPLSSKADPQARARALQQQKQQKQDQADREQDYGYLSYQRHIILGLEEVDRLVRALADELGSRGLTTPFIFSSLAIDVSPQGVRRLINAFLRTCAHFPTPDAEQQWLDEVRFAGPHELGMGLRWGLARVVRVVGGNAVRGLIAWEHYIEWADSEVAFNYPPAHFGTFLEPLPPLLRAIIFNVLSLLARLTAHSASSGHTPPTLSPLFGPLLFGLGAPALAFQHAYVHYLRATNAMEHVMLAFIRWQDTPSNDSAGSVGGSATSLGVPARLKDWIRGYPATLAARPTKHTERLTPRRGARTLRVVSVRRNVRMYTPDLVHHASAWASARGGASGAFGASKEWARVAPPTLKLPPRYSDAFRKRMDLAPGFHPATASTGSVSSTSSSGSSAPLDDDYFGLGKEDERFRSLTDLKWGEFEAMGFGGLSSDEKKLQFDLTESARTARAAKRATLTWTDFSASGFSRTDAPLNATLEFSVPVASSIDNWSEQQEEMRRKLKKTARGLPPFGWDTEPVMGSEEVIEEAFLDVFCDLVYGGGWMDMEREEEVDRECNWALVEYKSLPVSRATPQSPGSADPRTSTTVFLFEEFVPAEYRAQLSAGATSRRRLPFFFTPSKQRAWKPAATLNGRPYVIGATPTSPSVREVEFDSMLHGSATTKQISLARERDAAPAKGMSVPPLAPRMSDTTSTTTDSTATVKQNNGTGNGHTLPAISPPLYVGPRESDVPSPLRAPSPTKRSRFRLPVPGSGSAGSRTSGLPPSEYEDVDFETRLASTDDVTEHGGVFRRRSKDDAWVDILVANHGRRLGGQDAELRPAVRPAGARPPRRAMPDPEAASLEVERVLSGVTRPMSVEVGDDVDPYGGIEPMTVPHRSNMDDDRSTNASVQDVPREATPEAQRHTDDDDDENMHEPPKRRLGYFDLHPDRRPPQPDVPAPARAADNDDDDGADYPVNVQRAPAGFEPVEPAPPPKTDGSPKPPVKLGTSSGTPGRTAALIEMYRQRDAAATTSPSLVSPVRGLPRTPRDAEALPSPPKAKEAMLPPKPQNIDEGKEEEERITPEALEPPNLIGATPGRDSPYRYVHGAPLHNVTEEEEEE